MTTAPLPEFPAGRELRLDDKPRVDGLLRARQPELSAYTFASLFGWGEACRTRIARLGDSVVFYDDQPTAIAIEPLGTADPAAVIRECFARRAGAPLEFRSVHAAVAAQVQGTPGLTVVPDRDNFDYLYAAADLRELPGRKYDAKRNFVHRFTAKWKYEYVDHRAARSAECQQLEELWCEARGCAAGPGLQLELAAVTRLLANLEALKLRCGGIRVDGKVVAFALGEQLNDSTLVVHIEKAATGYNGLYQVINHEFARHEAADLQFINRESDLGLPGLRKAKESYQPVRLVEAWKVTRS